MGRTDRRRAVAVVSGGLDSVVSLAAGLETHDVRLVLFFDYGQRARASERASVIAVVSYYQLPLREVDVRWLGSLSPAGMRAGADESAGELRALDEVWIPNRNGVFLNVAAAFAESYGCDLVLTGFNREEAVEFPDNAPAYVASVNEALASSTRNRVEVASPTQDLDKREILWRGIELGAPLSLIWSCYRSGERMCGRCASCRRLRAALDAVPEERRPPIVFEDS
jgi:7-cyano-7-deazaguanine synthase